MNKESKELYVSIVYDITIQRNEQRKMVLTVPGPVKIGDPLKGPSTYEKDTWKIY